MGSKRKLSARIFGMLANYVPKSTWREMVFLDAFTGGGAVSLSAKLKGFNTLYCNDVSDRSQIVLNALIKNESTQLSLAQMKPHSFGVTPQDVGFVESHYGGSVFSQRHARCLDWLLGVIQKTHCPIQQNLLRLLLWKLTSRFVAYGTSIGTSNRGCATALDTGNYHKLNPKRFKDGSFERLLKPTLSDMQKLTAQINGGIFPALGPVYTCKQDIFQLLPTVHPDIAYFDPPYANTAGYTKELTVLDSVLFGKPIDPLPPSPFTQSVDAISTLLDLSHHIPVWLLSYNDKVISLDGLMDRVKAVDPNRTVFGQAIEYAHMPHVSKRINHEFLIIAVQKGV